LRRKINSIYLLPLEGGGLRWGWSRGSIYRARFSLNVIANSRRERSNLNSHLAPYIS
jgi:hypothetical protein